MSNAPPTEDELFAYAGGELTAEREAAVAAWLESDHEAADLVAQYRTVAMIVRGDDSSAPSAAVLERARAIFPARPAPPAARSAATSSLLDVLFAAGRRVVAELTFESGGAAPALAGFRSAAGATGATRQVVFEGEGTIIDLQLEREADGHWRIVGQVETPAAEQHHVVGLAPVANERSPAAVAVTTDQHGGFHLSTAAGRYNLFVRLPDTLLVLPDLVLE